MSSAFKCFADNAELGAAVREYVKDPSATSTVAATYGYPIGTWCVDQVTNFNSIFKAQKSFGESFFLLAGRVMTVVVVLHGVTSAADDNNHQWVILQYQSSNSSFLTVFARLFSSFAATTTCTASTNNTLHTIFLTDDDLEGWNTTGATQMRSMFEGAESMAKSIDNWDVSNVEDMGLMVRACVLAYSTYLLSCCWLSAEATRGRNDEDDDTHPFNHCFAVYCCSFLERRLLVGFVFYALLICETDSYLRATSKGFLFVGSIITHFALIFSRHFKYHICRPIAVQLGCFKCQEHEWNGMSGWLLNPFSSISHFNFSRNCLLFCS